VDLSPIQPRLVPPNVEFEVEKDWTFREKFGLIRCWGMEASFAERQRFMERAFRHLEPGGRLVTQALVKFSCSKYAPSLDMWWNLICKAAGEAGRPMGAASMHKNLMVDAGFVGVRKRVYKWLVNSQLTGESAGDIKWRILEFMEKCLEPLAMALLARFLGWRKDEVLDLCEKARKELLEQRRYACLHL